MVDFSHLSAGNSKSSPFRDFYAEFGVSKPNSPSIYTLDMAKSVPCPVLVSVDTDSSSNFEANSVADDGVGAQLCSFMPEIFKAAQALSHQGRVDVVVERKKSSTLMDFIIPQGFFCPERN